MASSVCVELHCLPPSVHGAIEDGRKGVCRRAHLEKAHTKGLSASRFLTNPTLPMFASVMVDVCLIAFCCRCAGQAGISGEVERLAAQVSTVLVLACRRCGEARLVCVCGRSCKGFRSSLGVFTCVKWPRCQRSCYHGACCHYVAGITRGSQKKIYWMCD